MAFRTLLSTLETALKGLVPDEEATQPGVSGGEDLSATTSLDFAVGVTSTVPITLMPGGSTLTSHLYVYELDGCSVVGVSSSNAGLSSSISKGTYVLLLGQDYQ